MLRLSDSFLREEDTTVTFLTKGKSEENELFLFLFLDDDRQVQIYSGAKENLQKIFDRFDSREKEHSQWVNL